MMERRAGPAAERERGPTGGRGVRPSLRRGRAAPAAEASGGGVLLPCWRGPCRSAGRSRGFRRGSRAGKPRSSTAAAGAARHGVAGAACPHHRLGSAPTLPLGPHTLAAPGVLCPRCRWGRMSLPPLGHEPTMQLEPYTCATAGASRPRCRWGRTPRCRLKGKPGGHNSYAIDHFAVALHVALHAEQSAQAGAGEIAVVLEVMYVEQRWRRRNIVRETSQPFQSGSAPRVPELRAAKVVSLTSQRS